MVRTLVDAAAAAHAHGLASHADWAHAPMLPVCAHADAAAWRCSITPADLINSVGNMVKLQEVGP